MRALLALVVAVAAVSAVGCYHDKYGLSGSKQEDYLLPPDEPRYNQPDTATYRAPPKPKQEETLMNRGGGKMGGNGPGGF